MRRFYVQLSLAALVLMSALLDMGCPRIPAPDQAPEAAFSATGRSGPAPLQVQFQSNSANGGGVILSWLWDFGDGQYSTQSNPTHTYNTPGQYTVSLTVTTSFGSDTQTESAFITVQEGNAGGSIIGPDGGTASAEGVSISVGAGAVTANTEFHIQRDQSDIDVFAPEQVLVISDTFSIFHDGADDNFSVLNANGVQSASLSIPFALDAVDPVDREPSKIHVLARLEDGTMLPILGRLEGGNVVVQVSNLPHRAQYVVVYRPAAYLRSLAVNSAKETTPFDWRNQWRVSLSAEMLQQLTALRLGTLASTNVYSQRTFSDTQTAATQAELLQAIERVHGDYMESGMRSPALVSESGAYTVILYNMSATYPTDFEAFSEVAYANRVFGSIVLDPRQLLAVTLSNASAAMEIGGEDFAQEFNFVNAFAQELFRALFEGYDYPKVNLETVNEGDVGVLHGLQEGLAAFLGQRADNLDSARSFGRNEYLDLAQPLFAPVSTAGPGYAVANQEFFFYIDQAFAPEDALHYLGAADGGVLEAIRTALAAQPNGGADLSVPVAQSIAAGAADQALREHLEIGLGEAYAQFAADRIIEHTAEARLRPSDELNEMLVLSPQSLSAGAVLNEELSAPVETLSLDPDDQPFLESIPPLSTRLIVLQASPLSTRVRLTFDTTLWEADSNGDGLEVTVYQKGVKGDVLGAGQTSLTVDGLLEDPETCLANIYVLLSNASSTTSYAADITVTAFADLQGPEFRVLDDYVSVCDPNYRFQFERTGSISVGEGAARVTLRTHILRLHSGSWRNANEVNTPEWEHYLTIVEPPTVRNNTALLMISSGDANSLPPANPGFIVPFVVASGSYGAFLQMVPNQPLDFLEESPRRLRVEDEIIAYSYSQYLDSFQQNQTDTTWPALLPMTRAAVRAMDTVQEFVANKPQAPAQIEDFVVTGASKRGWTTWLTAAADSRVRAIIPVVFDALNLDAQMQHHFAAYGFYAPAIHDYVDENVIARISTAAGQSLLRIVDPFEYRARLDMPKYMLNATGDEFFVPDSSRYYLDALPGENYLYYAPNEDHGLTSLNSNATALDGAIAFYQSVVQDRERPQFSWTFEGADRIVLTTQTQPKEVRLWQATNPSARDFRVETIDDEAWTSGVLTPDGPGRFVGQVAFPAAGWRAFMLEMIYPGADPTIGKDFAFTTSVRIIPNTFPGGQ